MTERWQLPPGLKEEFNKVIKLALKGLVDQGNTPRDCPVLAKEKYNLVTAHEINLRDGRMRISCAGNGPECDQCVFHHQGAVPILLYNPNAVFHPADDQS